MCLGVPKFRSVSPQIYALLCNNNLFCAGFVDLSSSLHLNLTCCKIPLATLQVECVCIMLPEARKSRQIVGNYEQRQTTRLRNNTYTNNTQNCAGFANKQRQRMLAFEHFEYNVHSNWRRLRCESSATAACGYAFFLSLPSLFLDASVSK